MADEDGDVGRAEVDDGCNLATDGHPAGIAASSAHSAGGDIGGLFGLCVDDCQIVRGGVGRRQKEWGSVNGLFGAGARRHRRAHQGQGCQHLAGLILH